MGGFLFRHKTWLFLALLAPWFFIGGPGYGNPRSVEEVWNLGRFRPDGWGLENYPARMLGGSVSFVCCR